MKAKRQKFLSRDKVEKQFQAGVAKLRTLPGYVNIVVKMTVRVQDADPNKAVVLQSQHSV
jgi:hypothetical protein